MGFPSEKKIKNNPPSARKSGTFQTFAQKRIQSRPLEVQTVRKICDLPFGA